MSGTTHATHPHAPTHGTTRAKHSAGRCLRSPALAFLAALALLPATALGDGAPEDGSGSPLESAPQLVAEAFFLCDPMPPGGRDLSLAVAMVPGQPDPATGEAQTLAVARLQLALAIGERAGLTVDVGLAGRGEGISTPAASLKVLLRETGPGATGVSASLDLFGSTHSLRETEAGLGLGVLRQLGPVGLRASAAVASAVSAWSPHLHAGASAAVALGPAWRGLVEMIAEVGPGRRAVSAGPTLKVALSEGTALVVGALFPLVRGGAPPTLAIQVSQSI